MHTHSLCLSHFESLDMKAESKLTCYACDLETRLEALSAIFKDIKLEDLQKLNSGISQASFNDFKSLLFTGEETNA